MNLSKLFELQRQLDEHIEREHPVQEGEDRLAKKILALQVELGELCNCWRGFKYWSHDQEPRRKKREKCPVCNGNGIVSMGEGVKGIKVCPHCDNHRGGIKTTYPLLEEFVDCLHFILSIGLELETTNIVIDIDSDYTGADTTETFIFAFETVIELANSIRDGNKSYIYQVYEELFNLFVGLGEKYLGFTWDEIEESYFEKNRINHERQESNY